MDLRVYAVWFDMVASDSRERWPEGIFDDPRVVEYWDEGQVVGRWFGARPDLADCGPIAWDVYYLFPKEARWKDVPKPLLSSGSPILRVREQLERDVDTIAREAQGKPHGG